MILKGSERVDAEGYESKADNHQRLNVTVLKYFFNWFNPVSGTMIMEKLPKIQLLITWSVQRLACDGNGRVRLENVSNVLDSFKQTIHFTVDINKPWKMRGSQTWNCLVPCITSQSYQQNSLRLTFCKDIIMVNVQPGCLTQFDLPSVQSINISKTSNEKYWFEDYYCHLDSQVYNQYFQDQQWRVLIWRLLLPFGLTRVTSIFPRTTECIDLKIFIANKSTFTCRWLSNLQ